MILVDLLAAKCVICYYLAFPIAHMGYYSKLLVKVFGNYHRWYLAITTSDLKMLNTDLCIAMSAEMDINFW